MANKRPRSNGSFSQQKRFKSGGVPETVNSVEFKPLDIPTKDESDYFSTDSVALANYRSTHGVKVIGHQTNYKPIESFQNAGFPKEYLEVTSKYDSPTPIQSQCWPVLLTGGNVIGVAKTGSGKTLAFGLPGLIHVMKKMDTIRDTTLMLIITPTRELATQIFKVMVEFAKKSVRIICIFGGEPRYRQLQILRRGVPHVIISVPGRLLDFLQSGDVDIKKVSYLVLDEADRMLDMGFIPDVETILGYIETPKEDRRTSLFSATWPSEIKDISNQLIHNPIKIMIGVTEGNPTASDTITQIVEEVRLEDKFSRLLQLLESYHESRKNRILIFVNTKLGANELESQLWSLGWNVTAIHGDKSQQSRFSALSEFTSGKCPLLIATDVASRGLDIPSVEYIINYTCPMTVEDYVHRIGRSGRAGAKGTSHTLFSETDYHLAQGLIGCLKRAGQEVPKFLFTAAQQKKTRKVRSFQNRRYSYPNNNRFKSFKK